MFSSKPHLTVKRSHLLYEMGRQTELMPSHNIYFSLLKLNIQSPYIQQTVYVYIYFSISLYTHTYIYLYPSLYISLSISLSLSLSLYISLSIYIILYTSINISIYKTVLPDKQGGIFRYVRTGMSFQNIIKTN